MQTRSEKLTKSKQAQKLLHQNIKDLENRTKPRSHKTGELVSQLNDEGIEILNSHLDSQTVIVWIWCHSQAAFGNSQKLYESSKLMDVLFENIAPSISKVIIVDRNEFKKTIGKYLLTHLS